MLLMCCLLKNLLSCPEDDEIPLSRLPSLESDGPNVDKTASNKLDEHISA